jgi:ADP-heptose:LPS heptosyltransferase
MARTLICSRSDRLGDLVLTLPAVAVLKKQLPEWKVGLHVSDYTSDLAELAVENGVCDFSVFQDASGSWRHYGPLPAENQEKELLVFFHGEKVPPLQRAQKFQYSLSPRSRLSTLWSYSQTLSQNRSRVEKSEMEYNFDLAQEFLARRANLRPPFQGLPALKIPGQWKVSQTERPCAAVFVNNGASAKNWALDAYLEEGARLRAAGYETHFHYGGVNAARWKSELEQASPKNPGVRILDPFPDLRGLLGYLSGMSYVVASSTGPLHLAHALGIPVLGVFPRAPKTQSFKRWRPCGYWHPAAVDFLEF